MMRPEAKTAVDLFFGGVVAAAFVGLLAVALPVGSDPKFRDAPGIVFAAEFLILIAASVALAVAALLVARLYPEAQKLLSAKALISGFVLVLALRGLLLVWSTIRP